MPNPLTPAKLATVWAKFSAVFPSTVTVQRMITTGKISSGPHVELYADVPCWFIEAGGSIPLLIATMLGSGTLKQADAHRAVFTGDKDVKPGDRLIKNNELYAVKQVKRDDLQIAIIADVEGMKVERA